MTDERQPIHSPVSSTREPELNKYFIAAIKVQASDLHLKVGQPPKLRIHGELKNTTGEVLTEERIEQLIFEILSPEQKKFFLRNGTLDFAYEIKHQDRFRVNIFRQRSAISLAARRISSSVPAFESLHLPAIIETISDTGQGLVLVVGPTGCGKSTTIASVIDRINRTRSCHIVTIEDPIEYLFKDDKAIISQRAIGVDVQDYQQALRYLMRQDPDVVLIGEMRDAETVQAAMRAAETGHLVFGTMHSANASQSIQRLLDLFPPNERDLVRQTLALALRAIISQILLPSIKEGISRVPAVEILIANSVVRKLISEKREGDLPTVIRSSRNEGMQDFTDSLCELITNGSIDPKEAYRYAPNLEELKMALKGIRTTASGIL
ncbi:MAG TPA: PilT/PilU family type 4a pilus ATPase [Sedimentisphaerales bacterium]|nr:PilT/PilU family type 4a pilus ATPase [Sedimentisphaerales bacterium]